MINGESHCGFTYHYIQKEVDAGNIILQVEEKIYEFDTQQSLYSRLMFKSLDYFNEVIDMVIAGNPGEKQSNKGKIYKRGCPHNGVLNRKWDINKQKRFIKAMINPPLEPAKLEGKDILSFYDLENMKFYFVVNGFLGSQGTIEFISNCYFTVNKYWMNLGLSSAPELIFIEESHYLVL